MDNKKNVRWLRIENLQAATAALSRIGVDPRAIPLMAGKAFSRAVLVPGVSAPAALILKQEMLSLGGDAAIHRDVVCGRRAESDVLLLGSHKQLKRLEEKLRAQPFGLRQAGEAVGALLRALEPSAAAAIAVACGGGVLRLGEKRTALMGILNVTPDSFSDGGLYSQPEAAAARAREMAEEGADIIDLGAESTRPGHSPVSAAEEWARLEPVLAALSRRAMLLSVDTRKAEVADKALAAGAHILNDIDGLLGDPDMAGAAAAHGAAVVLMHNRAVPDDVIEDILHAWDAGVTVAQKAGLPAEAIIVDPGIGFGKTQEQNLEILRRLAELKAYGLPLLLAASRKSVIGYAAGLSVGNRMEATMAIGVLGAAAGADILRVHDVAAHRRALDMTAAILYGLDSGNGEQNDQ
ncbi:MAG: dihydropteroate synthase [Gracilibacteraceae bacterium]|jgi:dihydropteroate synthase|nr:dihydropteroate synthase [Gracilibacteraceae bacterium]